MTLLEALVVVAITALIAALGFPAMEAAGRRAHMRFEGAELVADLHRARAAALHLDRPTRLTVDVDGRGWRWDGGALRLDPPLRLASDAPVIFYPDGSASGGVLVFGGIASAPRVEVDRTTGAVTRRGG